MMQFLRGLKGAIGIRYEGMEIKMTAENTNHRVTFPLRRWLESSSLLDIFTL
jgi:hypothetical protein